MQPKSLLLAFIAGYFLNSPATTTARLGRPGLRVSLIVSLFAQCVSADAQDFVSPAGDPEDLVQRPHDLHDGGRGRHEDVVAEESVIDMSELKALLGAVVHSVTALQDDLEKTAKTRKQRLSVEGLTFADEMTEDLKRAFEDVVEELKVAFTVVDETRTRAHEEIIGLALDKIGIALLAVCNKYNIKEQSARIHWETIRPPIESMMLLLGDLLARPRMCRVPVSSKDIKLATTSKPSGYGLADTVESMMRICLTLLRGLVAVVESIPRIVWALLRLLLNILWFLGLFLRQR